MKTQSFPLSSEEALNTGRTYYKSEYSCPKDHPPFFWAHNDACMACEDYGGSDHIVSRKIKRPKGRWNKVKLKPMRGATYD